MRRAFVLYEGNDYEREMAAMKKLNEHARVRFYAHEEAASRMLKWQEQQRERAESEQASERFHKKAGQHSRKKRDKVRHAERECGHFH